MISILFGVLWVLLMLYFASGVWSTLRRPKPTQAQIAARLQALEEGAEDDLCHVLDLSGSLDRAEPDETPHQP
jgi:hypothetical protein